MVIINEGHAMRRLQITMVAAATALMVYGLENEDTFAKTNSSSGSSVPPSASAGGSHSAPRGGPMTGAGPRFNTTPPWYNSGAHYHPITGYGVSGRTLSYPPVRGTMVPIHRDVDRLNGSSGKKSGRLQSNGTTRNHQITAAQTEANVRFGNLLKNDLSGKAKLDLQTSARLHNWKGKIDNVAEARRNHEEFRRAHRDRDWWRRRCAAIIFFDLGWWGWYDGWWYPAWGYDPYYSYYAYDQPIYDYNGLPPGQVVANVQSALQELGYFSYAADGVMGPLTRAAIANYQRDNLLPITGDIDPATLGSLGLTD